MYVSAVNARVPVNFKSHVQNDSPYTAQNKTEN